VKNAVEFLDLLKISTTSQKSVLEKIKNYRIEEKKETKIQSLESFNIEENGLNVPDYLNSLTTHTRLSRAEKIPDSDVEILEIGDRIEGKVRDYKFRIDSNERVLEHNCADWEKGRKTYRLCKHMNKVFLVLPATLARKILKNINESLDDWKFI
jgi:hypothetical protein